MKRYWFGLTDRDYNHLGAAIPDGWHKSPAIKYAKDWMKENNISSATLVVNSMTTDDILDMIDIELN